MEMGGIFFKNLELYPPSPTPPTIRFGRVNMFKGSNVFEFTKFAFKTKYNNTVVYSVNFRGENNKKNCWNNSLIKSTVNYIYCEQFFSSINVPLKLDDFLRES